MERHVVWATYLWSYGDDQMARWFDTISESERGTRGMNKGHVQNCRNYRRITLMSHNMKTCDRVVEARL